MKISQSRLRKIIQEEFGKVTQLKEGDDPFGERTYDHSMVSGVAKEIQWDIMQAFTFVLDLLEDVNAHTEYREVRKVLEKAAQSELNQASQEPVLGDVGPIREASAAAPTSVQEWKTWAEPFGLSSEYDYDGQLIFYLSANQPDRAAIAAEALKVGASIDTDQDGNDMIYTGMTDEGPLWGEED